MLHTHTHTLAGYSILIGFYLSNILTAYSYHFFPEFLTPSFFSSFRNMAHMNSTTKFADIAPGQQNCKVFGRLIRLWDAKNMSSKVVDPLISIDGIILAEDVSTI